MEETDKPMLEYNDAVIKQGDADSELLQIRTFETVKNNDSAFLPADNYRSQRFIRVPDGYYAVVHTVSGDKHIFDLENYIASSVDRAVYDMNHFLTKVTSGGKLGDDFFHAGISDIISTPQFDKKTNDEIIARIADSYVNSLNKHALVGFNGERAILPGRVTVDANMCVTLLSFVKKSSADMLEIIINNDSNVINEVYGAGKFIFFEPKSELLFMNSDGEGTKAEFKERTGHFNLGINDLFAMNFDDSSKLGAKVVAFSGHIETAYMDQSIIKGMSDYAIDLARSMGIIASLQHEPDMQKRMATFNEDGWRYNLDGTAVCEISMDRLLNPLLPQEGDYVIIIRGKPTPRSNGISDKRRIMVNMLGDLYHMSEEGKRYLEFLEEPSTIFYPVFEELIKNGLITSNNHTSGGAHNTKIAKNFMKNGLYVDMGNNLFLPDPREIAMLEFDNMKVYDAYRKWPMGNEAVVTARDPKPVIPILNSFNLEASVANRLVKATGTEKGQIGTSFIAYNGERIDFIGKN